MHMLLVAQSRPVLPSHRSERRQRLMDGLGTMSLKTTVVEQEIFTYDDAWCAAPLLPRSPGGCVTSALY